jgi:two-component system, NtrC family, sensor kinase
MSGQNYNDNIFSEIDKLNLQAWDKRISDSKMAQEISIHIIEQSRKFNYKKGLAMGLRTYGFCLIRISMHKDAETNLLKSLALFEELKDDEAIAPVYEFLGIIQRTWGNFAASLENIFKAITLSQQASNIENETTHYYQLGVTYRSLGNYEKSLDNLFKSLSLSRLGNYSLMVGYCINVIGSVYFEIEDYENALIYYQQGLDLRRTAGDKWGEAGSLDNIGSAYLKKNDWAKAIEYCRESLEINKLTGDKKGQANALLHIAEVYKLTGDIHQAKTYGMECLEIRQSAGDKKGEAEVLLFLSELDRAGIEPLSSEHIVMINKSLQIAEEVKAIDLLSKTHFALYETYKICNEYEQSLSHLEFHISLEKQLHKDAINQKMINLEISHRAEESKKEAEIFRLRNVELVSLYDESKKQKEEIEIKKKDLESMLYELKETQKQLIQSEKMASLGELTAGIAHEIQNPLNFVNNFSEVNTELIEDLKYELASNNMQQAIVIADDIKENEQKINHHGKRADAIVKGMLQHSRSNSGQKEPTDINALTDEYLRLAYHGLRAKDNSFNATLKTNYDDKIEKNNVVPQDIGRVILNLITNAFYSVNEKSLKAKFSGDSAYEPTVTVSTKKTADTVEISVKDNGGGIPQKVLDKIFQPFFTTKPTGEGTGLGLSLSYDIVKAHGGELKVKTKEGEGSEFIVELQAYS